MRQAGRYLPEYRVLRQKHSFEELSGNAELAAEVTLLPLARFPLDAAIIFADLMSPVGALGLDVRFAPGPVLAHPVRTAADVEALRIAGLSEREIFEATVFAAFRMAFSTVNDALGARPDWQLAQAAPRPVRKAVTFGRPSAKPVAGA
jgi:uroporphyrinogen decarboxylase